MKKMITVIAFSILCALPSTVFAGDLKVGCVHMSKALNESEAGKRAMKFLDGEYIKREEEANKGQEKLKTLKDEIDKKAAVWNKETRAKKEKEFIMARRILENGYNKVGKQLLRIRQETEDEIIKELWVIVEELGEKNGYDYVLSKSLNSVLYCHTDADMTDEVVEAHNKLLKDTNKSE